MYHIFLIHSSIEGHFGCFQVLTLDTEMQSLEFTQLVFSLALVQCFLTMLPFLHFGIVMYILCYYMLEVCDLLFYFDFTWCYS